MPPKVFVLTEQSSNGRILSLSILSPKVYGDDNESFRHHGPCSFPAKSLLYPSELKRVAPAHPQYTLDLLFTVDIVIPIRRNLIRSSQACMLRFIAYALTCRANYQETT